MSFDKQLVYFLSRGRDVRQAVARMDVWRVFVVPLIIAVVSLLSLSVFAGQVSAQDVTAPTVTSGSTKYYSDASLSTEITNGTSKSTGDTIYTKVKFSENMGNTNANGSTARPSLWYVINATETQYDIVAHNATLASGDCKAKSASDTSEYACMYTIGSSDIGVFSLRIKTDSSDSSGNSLGAAYNHAHAVVLNPKFEIEASTAVFKLSTLQAGGTAIVSATPKSGVTLQMLFGAVAGDGTNCHSINSGTTGYSADTTPPFFTSHALPANSSGRSLCMHVRRSNSNISQFNISLIKSLAKPTGLTARAGVEQVTLAWTNPSNSSITGYQYRQKAGGGSYGSWTNVPGSSSFTVSHVITGLTTGTQYGFQIRARYTPSPSSGITGSEESPASDGVTATPVSAPAAPTDISPASDTGSSATDKITKELT